MSPALEMQKSLGEWRLRLLFAATSDQSTSFKLFPKMSDLALKIESSLGKFDQELKYNEFQFRRVLEQQGANRAFRDQFFKYLKTENTSSSQDITRKNRVVKPNPLIKVLDSVRGGVIRDLYLLENEMKIKIKLFDKHEVILMTDNFPNSTILKLSVERGLISGDSKPQHF